MRVSSSHMTMKAFSYHYTDHISNEMILEELFIFGKSVPKPTYGSSLFFFWVITGNYTTLKTSYWRSCSTYLFDSLQQRPNATISFLLCQQSKTPSRISNYIHGLIYISPMPITMPSICALFSSHVREVPD